jgi:transposase
LSIKQALRGSGKIVAGSGRRVKLVELGPNQIPDTNREYPSQWQAVVSIASKIGCTPETLRKWVRRAEIDSGRREGVASDERARIKELERENRELRRANEILRKASAYFAQAELDRRPKR